MIFNESQLQSIALPYLLVDEELYILLSDAIDLSGKLFKFILHRNHIICYELCNVWFCRIIMYTTFNSAFSKKNNLTVYRTNIMIIKLYRANDVTGNWMIWA
jgi:hypothetical protein